MNTPNQTGKEKKIGYCGWHRTLVNAKKSIIIGQMESLTGKWLDCCKRCWNKRERTNRENPYSALFNLGMKPL